MNGRDTVPTTERGAANSIAEAYKVHSYSVAAKLGAKFFLPGTDHHRRELAKKVRHVIIMYTNRSGSNYLSELLASTGRLNCAQECLNADEVIKVARAQAVPTLEDYFSGIALSDSVDNIFSFKASLDHLALLESAGILGQIMSEAKVIHIERSDKLSQAISLCIAEQTGAWSSYHNEHKADAQPQYHYETIKERLSQVIIRSNDTTTFLGSNAIDNLGISYELLDDHPQQIVETIGRFIGIDDLYINMSRVRTSKQASATNQEWKALFLQDLAGCIGR